MRHNHSAAVQPPPTSHRQLRPTQSSWLPTTFNRESNLLVPLEEEEEEELVEEEEGSWIFNKHESHNSNSNYIPIDTPPPSPVQSHFNHQTNLNFAETPLPHPSPHHFPQFPPSPPPEPYSANPTTPPTQTPFDPVVGPRSTASARARPSGFVSLPTTPVERGGYEKDRAPWTWPARGERPRPWIAVDSPTTKGAPRDGECIGEKRKEEVKVPTLATRYVQVQGVSKGAEEVDLKETFIGPYGTQLRGIYTGLLRTHGIIVLVFYDVRDALQSLEAISSTPSPVRGFTKMVASCITRKSLHSLNSGLPNPLLSPSEGVLVVSIRSLALPIPPMPLPPSIALSILQNFGPIRGSRFVDEETWVVEYWDDRQAEVACRELDKRQYGGRWVFGCSFEPGVASTLKPPEQSPSPFVDYPANNLSQVPSTPTYDNRPSAPIPQIAIASRNLIPPAPQGIQPYLPWYPPPRPFESAFNPNSQNLNIRHQSTPAFEVQPLMKQQKAAEPQHTVKPPQAPLALAASSQWGIYREETIPASNIINLARIERGEDFRTTVMIKNVPNRMSDSDLMAFIDQVVGRSYDFLYLRIDFNSNCNTGYGFVNFTSVESLLKFVKARVGTRWNVYQSDKLVVASYANIQGKDALISRFRNSSIMEEQADCRPKIFYSSGPSAGLPEPFPESNDPRRKLRSTINAQTFGLFPATKKPVFKVAHALRGMHI